VNIEELRNIITGIISEVAEFNSDKMFYPDFDKRPYTLNMVKKLNSFFNTTSKEENPQEWEKRGGDQAQQWAKRTLDTYHNNGLRTKGVFRKLGGAGKNKGMGTFADNNMDPTLKRNNL